MSSPVSWAVPIPATRAPVADPMANAGASGPSTAPNTNVAKAAGTTDTATRGRTSKDSPSSGRCPP